MALTAGTLFAIQASATTGNTGGAGFNPANANFLTDLAATSANTASPIVTSATYTFVSGDIGAWVYVKSGTNWTAGWYQIASVAAGAATLSAAIGAAVQNSGSATSNQLFTTNTVAGCATVASPTAGTFGVDYSQQDAANSSITDAASVGSSTTLTSVTSPWSPVSVGNFFHLTTTGTGGFGVVGWYEIVSYNNAGSVVTDRTTNNGTALVAGTGQTGGAGRLNALEDSFFAMLPAASRVFVKNGSYTISGNITTANTNSTTTLTAFMDGFNTIRGDNPTGASRPLLVCAGNTVTLPTALIPRYMSFTTTQTAGIKCLLDAVNCKIMNTSASAGLVALTFLANGTAVGCELVSLNGNAVGGNVAGFALRNCYIHDSLKGITSGVAGFSIIGTLFEACSTVAIENTAAAANVLVANCTIYGREAKMGIGLSVSSGTTTLNRLFNNIWYGLTTAISSGQLAGSSYGQYNNFFNNTTDVTNYNKDATALALNPTFSGAAQLTGTTATSSGSVLTDSGADFSSVVDGVSCCRVVSATGATVANYLVMAHTTTTLTLNNAIGTGSAITYFVTTGHNFNVTNTSLWAAGFPVNGSTSTSYPTPGAIIPNPSGGGGGGSGGSYTFVG